MKLKDFLKLENKNIWFDFDGVFHEDIILNFFEKFIIKIFPSYITFKIRRTKPIEENVELLRDVFWQNNCAIISGRVQSEKSLLEKQLKNCFLDDYKELFVNIHRLKRDKVSESFAKLTSINTKVQMIESLKLDYFVESCPEETKQIKNFINTNCKVICVKELIH